MSPSDPFSDFDDDDRTVIRPSPGGRKPQAPKAPSRPARDPGMVPTNLQPVDVEGTNPLIVSAFTLLSLVPKLRNLPFHDAINELQDRLIDEVKNFENQALQKGALRNQVDTAKYLLCALIDETVLNTPWGSRSGWGHNSLSSLFFKKLVGGEEFFQILDQLKQQPTQNLDLLELAYLCLSMGFEGKFRYTNNGLLTLERERQELYLLIQRIKGDPQPELSINWQGKRELSNPLIRHVPLWVLAGIAGVMLMLIYMVFAFTIRDSSDRLYDKLFTLAQSIEKTQPMQLVQPLQVQKPAVFVADRFKALLSNEIAQKKAAVVDGSILRLFNMFRSGSADIKKDFDPILVKIAQALEKESVRIRIVGHTDNQRIKFSTRFASNWHLSTARAESTAIALANFGFPTERMRFEGMADKAPIAPNDTRANRMLNRRIDIHVR